MKFKICNRGGEENKKKEKEVYFKLCKIGENSIVLTTVNNKGKRLPGGNVLIIDSKGLYLPQYVNKNIGISLDRKNRVSVTKGVD